MTSLDEFIKAVRDGQEATIRKQATEFVAKIKQWGFDPREILDSALANNSEINPSDHSI